MQTRTTNGQTTIVLRYQYDNHLGSACLELGDIGKLISYEEYYPFGSTSYSSARSETEISLKRYNYCGKEKDEETGLYYYGMRYYADWLCRFVSVDPLQFKYPELTPFQYASNNPVTMIDLDGMEGVEPQQQNKQQSSDQVQEGLRDGSGSSAKPFVLMNEVVVSASKVEGPASDTKYQNTNIPLNLIPQFANPVDPSGGLGSAYAQQQQIRQLAQVTKTSEIQPYQKDNGEIRPAKSEYQKQWEFSAGPFADYIKNDPVIKSVATGGLIVTGGVAVGAAASTAAPSLYSVGVNAYGKATMFYGTNAGKVAIGVVGGVIINILDAGPDVQMPNPVSNVTAQGVDLLLKFYKAIPQQLNQRDTVPKK